VWQVDERIRAVDGNLNALQQRVRSQDWAVGNVVGDALSRFLTAGCGSP